MGFRKRLVRQLAAGAGFPELEALGIVCYTDSRIKVYNHCESIQTCTLGKLPYLIINHADSPAIDDEGVVSIVAALQEASKQERYPMDYDIEGFKYNFARAVCAVETIKRRQDSLAGRFETLIGNVLGKSPSKAIAETSRTAA